MKYLDCEKHQMWISWIFLVVIGWVVTLMDGETCARKKSTIVKKA